MRDSLAHHLVCRLVVRYNRMNTEVVIHALANLHVSHYSKPHLLIIAELITNQLSIPIGPLVAG